MATSVKRKTKTAIPIDNGKPSSQVDAEKKRSEFLEKCSTEQNEIRQRLMDEIHFAKPFMDDLYRTLQEMGAELSSGKRRIDVAWSAIADAMIAIEKLTPDWELDEECWREMSGLPDINVESK